MKKVLKTLLLAIMLCVLTFTMTGCGEEEETQNQEPSQQQEQENVSENEESNNENFSRGEWNDNQYNNEFAKITFNLPEGWVKATDEQIAEMMNVGVEMLNEDQQQEAELSEQTMVYGMVANNPNDNSNISITLEKPILTVTPEYYLTSVKQQLEALSSMQYTVGEQYEVDIAGESYIAVDAEVEGYGVCQSYYVKSEGDYIIGIIITAFNRDQVDEILTHFE